MKRVESIWQELESDQTLSSGLLYRRYSASVQPNIYVSLKSPERLRCIAAHISRSFELNITVWDKLKDIKVDVIRDEAKPDKQFLLLLLINTQHQDIFSALCEDLIQQVSDVTEEAELISELLIRLEKWRLMFEKLGQQGLSEEAQRGLYGELCFLRKYLSHSDNYELCVNSWKGPEHAVQDFQAMDWAVEVKTTHGKNHQKIQITSERQLDTAYVPHIILYHYSLDSRQNYGETLNDVVDDLLRLLEGRVLAYNSFLVKLLEANYFNAHRELYNIIGYSVRQENIYLVSEDFPRITEAQIAPGVGDVRYSLIISSNNWAISEEQLFGLIVKP